MLTASSFCGMAGQSGTTTSPATTRSTTAKSKPLFTEKRVERPRAGSVRRRPAAERRGVELFGTEQNRRYHPIPGAYTISREQGSVAYRPKTDRPLKEGEGYGVWSFHRHLLSADRDFAADLFIEDAGVDRERQRRGHDRVPRAASQSYRLVRRRVRPRPETCCSTAPTWASLTRMMKPGEIGNAITVGPYVTLARNAVPATGFASLNNLHLSDWLKQNGLRAAHGHRVTDGIP